MLNGHYLVRLSQERVEKRDDGTLELGILVGLNSDRGETFPQDDLADVGGDEERDSISETIALLEELIEELNDNSGKSKLENNCS